MGIETRKRGPTIRGALAEGSASLAAAGIETPGLDASLLLCETLNMNRALLLAAGPEAIGEASLAAFRQLLLRRQAGECVAYITGRKEFWGLEFLVNPSVLVPRPDTEILVEKVLEKCSSGPQSVLPLKVLDLCTGSGAVAIAIKHERPDLEVWATDISSSALETAKTNAARLLPPASIRFFQGNLYDALRAVLDKAQNSNQTPNPIPHTLFSIIISNPPYIPSGQIAGLSPEVRSEPALALDGGRDGLDVIKAIISRAKEFLLPGGSLLLEADPCQMREIETLYDKAGFENVEIHRDLSGSERVISGSYA
jgi:release factor glutamine methyltransferase